MDPHTADLWEDGGGWRWGRFSYWAGEVFRLFVVHAAAFISIFFLSEVHQGMKTRQGTLHVQSVQTRPFLPGVARLHIQLLALLNALYTSIHQRRCKLNAHVVFCVTGKNANILCQQNSSCD